MFGGVGSGYHRLFGADRAAFVGVPRQGPRTTIEEAAHVKKYATIAALGLGLAAGVVRADDPPKGKASTAPTAKAEGAGELKDLKSKVSYGLGLGMAKQFKQSGIEVDPQLLAKGLADGLADGKPLMSEEEIQEALQTYQKELVGKLTAKRAAEGEKNKSEGDKFLAANSKKEGVKTTKSGLQYKVLKEGTGRSPKPSDTVKAHYKGTLIDGTEFDSSYKRGEPTEFPVDGVIKGWTEALQLMKVGSKWQLFIPSALAYGEQGSRAIPPNSTLVFEVELLGIQQ